MTTQSDLWHTHVRVGAMLIARTCALGACILIALIASGYVLEFALKLAGFALVRSAGP